MYSVDITSHEKRGKAKRGAQLHGVCRVFFLPSFFSFSVFLSVLFIFSRLPRNKVVASIRDLPCWEGCFHHPENGQTQFRGEVA